MASMTSLNDNIYPVIDGSLKSNSHVIVEIQNIVSEYLDKNMNKLSTSGPIYRTLFLDNDKNAIFKATGTSPELVNRVIKESAYIKNHWRNIASPFIFGISYSTIQLQSTKFSIPISFASLSLNFGIPIIDTIIVTKSIVTINFTR